jgi:hypothetical protein
MATYYRATTVTIDSSFCLHAESLHEDDVPNGRMNMEIFESLPLYRQELICPSVSMRSRGAWAIDMIYHLCRMAKIDGLLFLSGGEKSSPFKTIQILADDEDGEPGATYVAKYGFLLDKQAMEKVAEDIDRFFDWSSANVDALAANDLMGFFAFKDGILEAIQNPIVFNKFTWSSSGERQFISCTSQIDGYEDGDGPWYFYSWLRSVQQVIKSALIFQQPVLHTVDNYE